MTIRGVLAALLAVLAAPAFGRTPYVDLTPQFAKFADETVGMEEKARVALFRKRMNALFPGFYEPRNGATSERYDARVARALREFPALRPQYERAQREFPPAYASGIRHFRTQFPGFKPNVPIYFVHSLGEMDGGTRELGGKTYLVFGADVIGRYHTSRDIGPFLDHELFHVEHGKYFRECETVWCSLWIEGLATYAAKTMNPGADDAQLLLTSPEPIRAPTDAKWAEALCLTRSKLDSTMPADFNAFFVGGNSGPHVFPERFGYYVGMRLAEQAGKRFSLAQLAHMAPTQAKSVVLESLDKLSADAGGCR